MDTFSSATRLEKRLVHSATEKQIPLGGGFELLPLCNMNCRMCFLRLSPEEMKQQGRLRSVDEWLSLAKEAKEAGLLFLLLTGGEPFLYPDFIRLYQGLCELGFIITINTNGTLITEEIADVLAAHKPRRVNITLYGSSDEIYKDLCQNPRGFTQTMRAIELLKERNIDIKLNGSVTNANKEDFENILRIAHELDLAMESNSYMFPCARKGCMPFEDSSRVTPEEAAKYFMDIKWEELSREEFTSMIQSMSFAHHFARDIEEDLPREVLPCRAGLSSFWINWKGNMTPCVFMEEPSIPVFETGFKEAWDYIKEKRCDIYLPAKCTTCAKRPFCDVCGAAVLSETGGTAEAPEYLCKMTEMKLEIAGSICPIRRKE